MSLRPPNMKSVYELSQEEGGKDRATATAIDKVDAPAVSVSFFIFIFCFASNIILIFTLFVWYFKGYAYIGIEYTSW